MKVNVSVAAYSLSVRKYYVDTSRWRAFASVMKRAAASHGDLSPVTGAGKVLVLLREGGTYRQVHGLDTACAHESVQCVRSLESMRLADLARVMEYSKGLVASHGAGLASLIYMPTGARFAEIDSVLNINKVRMMYQYLAGALGLRTAKVWLNRTGHRLCPQRILRCRISTKALSVFGCRVGYRSNATITRAVLEDILQDVGADRVSPHTTFARDCGLSMDTAFLDPKRRPHHWQDMSQEMARLY